jgi:hypothetical protein
MSAWIGNKANGEEVSSWAARDRKWFTTALSAYLQGPRVAMRADGGGLKADGRLRSLRVVPCVRCKSAQTSLIVAPAAKAISWGPNQLTLLTYLA